MGPVAPTGCSCLERWVARLNSDCRSPNPVPHPQFRGSGDLLVGKLPIQAKNEAAADAAPASCSAIPDAPAVTRAPRRTRPRDNAAMNSPTPAAPLPPLTEADLNRLQTLLDRVPEPLESLDVSMLDGFLCGVLLQPQAVPTGAWLKHVCDIDGRPLPADWSGQHELQGLVQRRYRELAQAIAERQWFDPWIFELDEDATPLETALPWVAGFSAAMELFPGLMEMNAPEALEPMAVLYAAFDAEDLEDADELLEEIATLEPPSTMDEAVEDVVQSVLRLADVSRPQRTPSPASRPAAARRGPPRGRH